jgi:hypothetical protein
MINYDLFGCSNKYKEWLLISFFIEFIQIKHMNFKF